MKKILLGILSVYQYCSRFFSPVCRFYPSCSQYTREAIQRYGVFPGIYLGVRRLLKCHPAHPGGFDPLA